VLEVYRQYWRINLLTTLEYRANFLLWLAFTLVYHGSAIAALWIMLNNFPSMNGWDFRNMAFLYALWMSAHAINTTFFSTIGDIPEWIRDGEFDRLLVRPLDELFQVIATPGQIFPDELLLALMFLVVATAANHIAVSFAFVGLLALVIAGGALIDLGIGLLISTAAFWFVQVDALRWIVLQLEQEFTRYPLSIYSRGVRLLLAFVIPFGFMNYFPASYFLQKADNGLGLPLAVGILTPAIGVAFVIVAYVVWRFGLQRYQGVGH
jgi:ABC-2 type transport system permease protein